MTHDDATDLDLVRAYADGGLPPAARAAFERRLEAEPELAETLAAYAGVRDLPEMPVPACEVAFESLEIAKAGGGDVVPAARPASWLARRWAPLAAAALLLLGLGLSYGRLFPAARTGEQVTGESGALALRSIAIDPLPPVAKAEPVPSATGDYRPSGPRGLRLLANFSEARAVAEEVRRPIVAFVYHPTCPYCVHMREKGPFQDASVAAEAEAFVLVELDVMKGVSAEVTEAMENGPELAWPYFLVLDPEGKRIGGFGGDHDANTLARAFEHAAGSLPSKTRSDSLPWDTMHRRHDALAAAEGEKDAEKRFATLRRLAAENAAGPVGRRASALLAAARAAAQRVLFEAREVAAREGAAKAAEAIDAALAAADSGAAPAFEPAARDDLVRVRDRLREKGSFPTLEVSK